MNRYESKRFRVDVETCVGDDDERTLMRHLKIFCEEAMQVDLWLTSEDVWALKNALDYSINRKEEK